MFYIIEYMKTIIRFLLFAILLLIFHGQAVGEITTLVSSGDIWTYLDDGSNMGESDWQAYSFNDSGWSTGAAELGYGDGDEATVVSYGPADEAKYVTTYFRKTFSVNDPSVYNCLKLRLLRDDGAIVYINGTEVKRSNMPDGEITYQTLASETVVGGDESRYFVYFLDPSVLNAGESNVIAIEIHQVLKTSSDVSFDLELIASTSACLRKGPYLLYTGDNTEMNILWQLADTDSSKIEWGLDTNYSAGETETSEYGSRHQHKYTITGLTPGRKYYYRISANATIKDYVSTGSFVAAPVDQVENVKFLVYGDTRSFPDDHDMVSAGMISTYTSDPSYQTMLLAAGDLVNTGRDESSWTNEFFDPAYTNIQEVLANLAYQACVGNHELSGTDGDLYEVYFPYPYYASGYYWSFDYGPVHVAVVDQYVEGGYDEGTNTIGPAQLSWLETDLASTDKQWKFIIFHEPGWSAGGHANNAEVQASIQPLCEEYGVSIVFAGHNHYYARAKVNGVHHITTGGGGAPLRTPDTGYPYIKVAKSVHHYCKIDISKNVLKFEAVQPDGTVIDSFKVNLITTIPALLLLLN